MHHPWWLSPLCLEVIPFSVAVSESHRVLTTSQGLEFHKWISLDFKVCENEPSLHVTINLSALKRQTKTLGEFMNILRSKACWGLERWFQVQSASYGSVLTSCDPHLRHPSTSECAYNFRVRTISGAWLAATSRFNGRSRLKLQGRERLKKTLNVDLWPPRHIHTREHIHANTYIQKVLGFVKIRSQESVLLTASYASWYFILTVTN